MKYRHQVKPDTKKLGQLISEDHWSTRQLAISINITRKDIQKWAELKKPYKKLKEKSYLW